MINHVREVSARVCAFPVAETNGGTRYIHENTIGVRALSEMLIHLRTGGKKDIEGFVQCRRKYNSVKVQLVPSNTT